MAGRWTFAAAKLRIAYVSPSISLSLPWVAKEGGILAKCNLAAEILLIPGSPRLVQTLISGDVDVIFAGVTALIRARAEELIFRLPLRYSAINLSISALLFTLFPVGILLIRPGSFVLATSTERWLWRAVFAILIASVVFVLVRIEPVKRLVRSIWSDHFRFVLYPSCFAFGLVHLFNYRFASLTVESLLLAPLLVVPQIISGFILAFARMRLGIVWCIVLHTAHNFLVLLTIGQLRPRS